MASLLLRLFRATVGFLLLALLPGNLVPAAESAARSVRIVERPDQQGTLNDLAKRYPELAATLKTLMAEARARGSVKVTVKLAVPFTPAKLLSLDDRLQQQRDIEKAVAAVRRGLPIAKGFSPRKDIPYIDLTLDAGSLARLQTLPGLSRISRPEQVVWPRDVMAIAAGKGFYATAAAARALATVSPKTTGRRDADPETAPYQVAIYFVDRGRKNFFCSGALVAKRFVITPVLCAVPTEYSVAVSRRSDGSGEFHDVKRIYVHPEFAVDYNFEHLPDYDVAIMELATPVEGVTPATLASVSPSRPGTVLQRSSFAFWEDEATPLQQLNEVLAAPVNGLCGGNWLPSTMFCTDPVAGESLWDGEMTSLLTIENGSGGRDLVGLGSILCSFGDVATGCPKHYYTDLANPAVRGFISNLIEAADHRLGFRVTYLGVTEQGDDTENLVWDFVTDGPVWLPGPRNKAYLWVERASGEGTVSVRYRSRPIPQPPPGSWWGAAKAGWSEDADYRPLSGLLTFHPGETSKRIALNIVDDNLPERSDVFHVDLLRPSPNWTIDEGASWMDITIRGNDGYVDGDGFVFSDY